MLDRGEKQRKREKEREREKRKNRVHANRVTFVPRRKLEQAQWEFNEAR